MVPPLPQFFNGDFFGACSRRVGKVGKRGTDVFDRREGGETDRATKRERLLVGKGGEREEKTNDLNIPIRFFTATFS